MTTDIERDDEALLAPYLDAARKVPAPSADFMTRVLADADAVHADRSAAGPALAGARPGLGFWSGIRSALGGWPAVAGLAAATVAGVWIGFAQPGATGTSMAPLLNLAGLQADNGDWLVDPDGSGFVQLATEG
jgi:hypothetical protein